MNRDHFLMAVEQNRQGQEGIWHMCVKTQTSERGRNT